MQTVDESIVKFEADKKGESNKNFYLKLKIYTFLRKLVIIKGWS